MFGKLGPLELFLILGIVLLIFGAGKLPEVGSAIGKSIRAFRQGQKDDEEEKKESKANADSTEVKK
jgi:sec-independent protein translocase protein TatA